MMQLLAIDPGIEKVGYAIFDVNSTRISLLSSKLIKTDKKLKTDTRLNLIYKRMQELLTQNQCAECVMERVFMFKNKKTINTIGQAQGVIALAIEQAGASLYWLTPLQIKQAVTGFGRADKKSIKKMLEIELKIDLSNKEDDETDAIACGLAHFYINYKERSYSSS